MELEKEILLNDQGLRMYVIIDGDNVSFEFDKNINFLHRFITLNKDNLGNRVAYLGKKRIVSIKDNKVTQISKISSTEIRILRALYNYSLHMPNYQGLMSQFKELKENIERTYRNLRSVNHIRWDDKQHFKTELHTHLIEILNADEFIDFVSQFNITFPLDINGCIDIENGIEHKFTDIIKYDLLDKVKSTLALDLSKETDFDTLETIVKNRSELIKRCATYLYDELSLRPGWVEREKKNEEEIEKLRKQIEEEKKLPRKKRDKEKIERLNNEICDKTNYSQSIALAETYELLLETSLEKLKGENIEYSEISFSSPNTLRVLSKKHKNDDNFKLLMSINRDSNVTHFKKASNNLEELLHEGTVIGLDIMGYERPITDEEYESFKDKYEWILPTLHMYPGSVLRIHAGEFVDATDNVYKTLLAIKETSEKINSSCMELFGEDWGKIPPPRIRIGHGINIEKKPELIDLLRELEVIVEFNISSNFALGHVKELEDLPIKYYEDNNINFVFATDGGGMYSTSILQEENLAMNLSNKYVGSGKRPLKVTDYVKNVSNLENEIIKDSKKINKPSEHDKVLHDRYKTYLESKPIITKTYDSFVSALEDENKAFGYLGENMLEIDKIQAEIRRVERYMIENDITLDSEYVNKRIAQIRTYLSNSQRTDEAKIYLFLLEKEKFPELDSSFKTLEYIYNPLTNSKENIVVILRNLLSVVKNVYDNEEINNSFRRL